LINNIKGATKLTNLADKLLNLNQRTKLKQPVVGTLEATLHVYRAMNDGKDITKTFGTTLLPLPQANEESPLEFSVTMKDILGESTPNCQDPADSIMFRLEGLRDFIKNSIPDTERVRASHRAEMLLKRVGEWEEQETFAQSKRQCLNPSNAQKYQES